VRSVEGPDSLEGFEEADELKDAQGLDHADLPRSTPDARRLKNGSPKFGPKIRPKLKIKRGQSKEDYAYSYKPRLTEFKVF
jgi:hypothetical protein